MINNSGFYLFLTTAFILNITPGADMMFVLSRSLSNGVKVGVISALGIGIGCIVHILLAVAGLSVLISQSLIAYEIIKFLGAGYLIYLGIKLITQKQKTQDLIQNNIKHYYTTPSLLKQGILTNILNPKVALFFLAFLPQFITKSDFGVQLQMLFLGSIFTVSGTIVNILVAIIIGHLGNKLNRFSRFWFYQHKIAGTIIIFIGIRLALLNKS